MNDVIDQTAVCDYLVGVSVGVLVGDSAALPGLFSTSLQWHVRKLLS